ncbi:MAG: YhcH/YjgK/YiaL family protein [Syntrophothermus sp.]
MIICGQKMILDNLKNSFKYSSVSPFFEKAFSFLNSENLRELPEGRHEIWGEEMFAIVSKMNGKKKEEAFLEFHNKYTDIHYLIEGYEIQGWKSRQDCTDIKTGYDNEKEVGFFSDPILNWITMHPGEFTIYFPEDAHAPAISDEKIHKVIIKVLADS